MTSPQNVHIDLNSVKGVRSIRRVGGWSPTHWPVAGKVLIGVGSVCLVGGILAGVLVPLLSARPNTESGKNEMTAITSTSSITTNVTTAIITIATTTIVTTTTTTPSTFSYRGIYIDGFNSILGNNNSENSLLSWCVSYNFNVISLYDLNTILGTSSNWNILAQFIKKARTTYGINQVAAVRGASADFIQNANYDSSRTDPNERFTVYNLELEWWNNCTNCNFSFYTTVLQTMNDAVKNTTPSMIREIYMGWFKNPEGQDFAQATTLESLLDRIMIHDYQTVPQVSYLQNRTTYLGQAANSQNLTVDLIVIFSAEHSFMYDYFNMTGPNNTFYDAYVSVLNQFNTSNFNYKANVRFIGYQIYCYSLAKSARPV